MLPASQRTLEELHLHAAPLRIVRNGWTPGLTHFSMLRNLSLWMWMPPDDAGLLSRLPTSLQSLKITTTRPHQQISTPADRWENALHSTEADVLAQSACAVEYIEAPLRSATCEVWCEQEPACLAFNEHSPQ